MSIKRIVITSISWTPFVIVAIALGLKINMWQYWALWGACLSTAVGQMIVGDYKQ